MCIERVIPKTPALRAGSQKGFTFIELVVTLVVVGILMSLLSGFIIFPLQTYVNTARRAKLVDSAEMALRRIERDVHRAVPNSLRVRSSGSVQSLELVHAITAFRYRAQPPGDFLSFNVGGESQFDVLEEIDSELLGSANYRLSINHRGESGTNLYANADVITPESTTVTLSNVSGMGRVALSSPFQFTSQSPRQRVYLIDTPVTYRCNPSNSGSDPNSLKRFWGYSIQNTQPIDTTSSPLNSANGALLSLYVSQCEFEYLASDPSERYGVLNMSITISDGDESVRLFHQMSVGNAP